MATKGVYILTAPTGKSHWSGQVYVGKSVGRDGCEGRMRQHFTMTNTHGRKMNRTVKRFPDFSKWGHRIVRTVPWLPAHILEQVFIAHYDSYRNGLNGTPGGERSWMETALPEARSAALRKRAQNMGADRLSAARHKQIKTMGKEGLLAMARNLSATKRRVPFSEMPLWAELRQAKWMWKQIGMLYGMNSSRAAATYIKSRKYCPELPHPSTFPTGRGKVESL